LRYTLLAAIDKADNVIYDIYDKSVNGEVYQKFIDANNQKFINKIILQDNVKFHHSKILKSYCTVNNIQLKYISAYTPEFNLIELFLSSVKKYYKNLNHNNIINDIKQSINHVIKTINFNNYYSHSYKCIQSY